MHICSVDYLLRVGKKKNRIFEWKQHSSIKYTFSEASMIWKHDKLIEPCQKNKYIQSAHSLEIASNNGTIDVS